MSAVTLRSAISEDAESVFALIHELAVYERLAHAVDSDPAMIAAALFGQQPRVFCDVAEVEGRVEGFALWFYTFSTFRGRHGLYLEDLFVRPAFRGLGIGKALLRRLAARCRAEGLPRLDWQVLDWNEPAIRFYKAQGAQMVEGWLGCRVEGDALRRLAGDGS